MRWNRICTKLYVILLFTAVTPPHHCASHRWLSITHRFQDRKSTALTLTRSLEPIRLSVYGAVVVRDLARSTCIERTGEKFTPNMLCSFICCSCVHIYSNANLGTVQEYLMIFQACKQIAQPHQRCPYCTIPVAFITFDWKNCIAIKEKEYITQERDTLHPICPLVSRWHRVMAVCSR